MPSSASAATCSGLRVVGEQTGVHLRVQRLDPAVEHLGEAGDLLDGRHRNTGARNGFRGRTGGDDVHARLVQAAAPGRRRPVLS